MTRTYLLTGHLELHGTARTAPYTMTAFSTLADETLAENEAQEMLFSELRRQVPSGALWVPVVDKCRYMGAIG